MTQWNITHIRGIPVSFPHDQPYPSQRIIMKEVVNAILDGEHALLESPTGTGKSVAIICAALATLEHIQGHPHRQNRSSRPCKGARLTTDLNEAEPGNSTKPGQMEGLPMRIFYATRTHEQISQLIRELRKTGYLPKSCVLGSRKRLCIREDIRSSDNYNERCKELLKKSKCEFQPRTKFLVDDFARSDTAWDIEDLVELGTKKNACPYYASQELFKEAEVIFCPYSYLMDPRIRAASGIDISGDVVIFDEGHNIEDVAREAMSLRSNVTELFDLSQHITELDSFERVRNKVLQSSFLKISNLVQCMKRFANAVLQSGELVSNDKFTEMRTCHGPKMLEMLAQTGLNGSIVQEYNAAQQAAFAEIYKNVQQRRDLRYDVCAVGSKGKLQRSTPQNNVGTFNLSSVSPSIFSCDVSEACVSSLKKLVSESEVIVSVLSTLFQNDCDFAIFVRKKTTRRSVSIYMDLQCLNAAIALKEISQKSRAVIVTSGTLSPFHFFSGEFGMDFGIQRSCPHAIDIKRRLHVSVATEGPHHVVIDASFKGSQNQSFRQSLCKVIMDYCTVIPNGIMVFFPSYRMMNDLLKFWRISGEFFKIRGIKGKMFVEPSSISGEGFQEMVRDYKRVSKTEKGAIFLCVFRGKMCEGLDFRDEMCRGVVVIGIPFLNKNDPTVDLKMKWNSRKRLKQAALPTNKKVVTGEEWYRIQAYRALNQAIGRVMRHKEDYGSVILLDQRFQNQAILGKLSVRVQDTMSRTRGPCLSHNIILRNIREFFDSVINLEQSDSTPFMPPLLPAAEVTEQEKDSTLQASIHGYLKESDREWVALDNEQCNSNQSLDYVALAKTYSKVFSLRCFICVVSGNTTSNCNTSHPPARHCLGEYRCFRCTEIGHRAVCCPNLWDVNITENRSCRMCRLSYYKGTHTHQYGEYGKACCPYMHAMSAVQILFTTKPQIVRGIMQEKVGEPQTDSLMTSMKTYCEWLTKGGLIDFLHWLRAYARFMEN